MSSDSDIWEPELLESHLHGHNPENEVQELVVEPTQSKRGPKKLPLMWSRVISISEDSLIDVDQHEIDEDMVALQALPRLPRPRRDADWSPLFLPTQYSKDHQDISMVTYKLGEKRLKSLGIEVSKLRDKLREAALQHDKGVAFVQGQDIHDVSRLAQRIRRGDYNDGALKKQLLRPDFKDNTAVGSRRYSRKRKPLSTQDKIDITHRVLVQFEK